MTFHAATATTNLDEHENIACLTREEFEIKYIETWHSGTGHDRTVITWDAPPLVTQIKLDYLRR